MKEIISRVWRAIIEFDLIEANDRILIGLSGGKEVSAIRLTNEVLAPFSSRRRTRYANSVSCVPTGA